MELIHQTSGSAACLQAEADRFLHEAVDLITRARSCVVRDQRSAARLLHADRARVHALLGRYQRFKHASIFDPVIKEGDTARSATARALKCECLFMGETFGAYFDRWQHIDVSGDWQTYRDEMIAMSETLMRHLEVEHAHIGTLLAATAAATAANEDQPTA